MGSPKVLVVAPGFDYGDRSRGRSYEYHNALLPLRDVYERVLHYDFTERIQAVGKPAMNQELIDLARTERPDVSIFFLYTDELMPRAVLEMRRWTTTVGYFYDDLWRHRFADFWARQFDLVTSGVPAGVRRFQARGIRNVIHSTFGFNANLYRPLELPVEHDVSFVGIYHPFREWMIDRLRAAGHDVVLYGHRWPNGRLPIDDVVKVINRSRISLNLSDGARWEPSYILAKPIAVAWNVKFPKREGVKARHFEIAACGSFQLSYQAEDLATYLVPGQEVATFADAADLVDKVRYYLSHTEEREEVARAGQERARREYSAQRLLKELVEEIIAWRERCKD